MENMNSSNQKTNLQKLLEKQAKIKKQIKLEQKKADEKAKEVHIQKCVLVGALILDHINSNGELSKQILNVLDSGIKSESDRKLLELKSQPNTGGNTT